jgi:hypothetical protein
VTVSLQLAFSALAFAPPFVILKVKIVPERFGGKSQRRTGFMRKLHILAVDDHRNVYYEITFRL